MHKIVVSECASGSPCHNLLDPSIDYILLEFHKKKKSNSKQGQYRTGQTQERKGRRQ